MRSLTFKAPAKINLFLLIQGRRSDGYHNIFTLLQKVSLWDEIELSVNNAKKKISLECSDSNLTSGPDNLAYRAAALFLQKTGLDIAAKIFIRKKIPLCGGLGGGSSDAASVLKGLNELAGFPLSPSSLHLIGSRLGADVPFFLLDAPAALGRGTGIELEVIHTTCRWYVLVNPGFGVSTRWAYENFALTRQDENTIFDVDEHIKTAMWRNDLENVIMAEYPVIGRIKTALTAYGAEAALMSGSGSTVLGAFSYRGEAKKAADSLKINNGFHCYLVESL